MLVIPVYNKIITPESEVYFQTPTFVRLAGKTMDINEKVILIVQKEPKEKEEWTEDSFYPIGVTGRLSEISPNGYVRVTTEYRVDVESVYINANHNVELTISRRPDVNDLTDEENSEKLQGLKSALVDFSKGFQWEDWARTFASSMRSLGDMASMLSPWVKLNNEERYAMVAEDSRKKRAELIEQMSYEYFETAKVTGAANASQQKEYQDRYKESAIKKQMEFLQKELDSMHPENVTDVQMFEQKINESGMNETAEKEARKVLNRLKKDGQEGAESGMLYDYLDFVTGLSWKAEEQKFTNLADARKILDEDHYGLDKVKKRILQQIAVMNLKKKQQGSILLFEGAPGTGKTSIGKSIARALGREYVRVSLGGVSDEADIRGHRRTYIGAMPGRIMDGIRKSGVSNPVMVLDEVDKLSHSYNGDPSSALLEVLDPEQNNTFTDHYMNVPYDLSNVLFICTANTLDTIPRPLLDRMEVIHFNGYTPDEKLQIAREHLIPKAMEATGIPKGQLQIDDDTINKVIADYTGEAGVRGLRKRFDTICRNAAVKISEDRDAVVEITVDQLREELDMRPVHHDDVLSDIEPGVVTGMAWTQVGGEILYIETLFTKGDGKTIITGQLGDVMRESAQIAVSLVKSAFPEKADMFRENDLHIHVPEGAVPKDGPSAGITLTTALASLVTGKKVDPKIAMTGEVSLRGAVTAIGGLPEKLMAAQRAGVKHVFIPDENMDDLRDVPQEVKDSLEITPVRRISDVLAGTGILETELERGEETA